jgi:hypothetical protein
VGCGDFEFFGVTPLPPRANPSAVRSLTTVFKSPRAGENGTKIAQTLQAEQVALIHGSVGLMVARTDVTMPEEYAAAAYEKLATLDAADGAIDYPMLTEHVLVEPPK